MSLLILRGNLCLSRPEDWYCDMWRRKKAQYYSCTSAAVSFFQIKKIYCVSFVSTTKWFENIEDAEKYKCYLYENFFFDLELICNKDAIVIKEYYIPKMFRI